MKTRLDILKDASDFAFQTIAETSAVEVDILCSNHCKKAGVDQEDYPLWKSSFAQSRQQFLAFAQIPAPSEKLKPKVKTEEKPTE